MPQLSGPSGGPHASHSAIQARSGDRDLSGAAK